MNAEEIWPHVHDAPTFTAMCRKLNDLGVLGLPASIKRPIARELCERLGFEPSDRSFVHQLTPRAHTSERADRNRAASRVANAARYATPEGRAKHLAASQASKAASLATPEGREKSRAASRAATAARYATPEGREKIKALCRAYRVTEKGREKSRAATRAYLATPKGQEKHRAAACASYRATRATPEGLEKSRATKRAAQAAYFKPGGRYYADPLYRLKCLIRRGVARIPQATETTKTGSTLVLPCGTKVKWRELLGCTFAEARAIIESRFLPGMTWKNQGKVWHLDHRMPLKAYQDNPTLDVLRVVQHIDNLWPLWGPENLEKGDKYCPIELAALLAQRAAA